MNSPFVLFCSGEDSGDVLGKAFVQSVLAKGYKAVGSGGPRMQAAGLLPAINYEELPVSGFGDVLPQFFRLKKNRKKLIKLLENSNCIALIAIDYPGFNMKLCAYAKKLHKPVLYVAPPQVWAWKQKRVQKLTDLNLAVLFVFEKSFYEQKGCLAQLLKHPFCSIVKNESIICKNEFLLLPGSRVSQVLRNLNLYLQVAKKWHLQNENGVVSILASRSQLVKKIEAYLIKHYNQNIPSWISVIQTPEEDDLRKNYFAHAKCALAAPGTVTYELAASGVPFVVATIPDVFTYCLGCIFVRSAFLAMPNILVKQKRIEEFILLPWQRKKMTTPIFNAIKKCNKENAITLLEDLKKIMKEGKSPEEIISSIFNA